MDNDPQASGPKLTDTELAIVHLVLCEDLDKDTTDRYLLNTVNNSMDG